MTAPVLITFTDCASAQLHGLAAERNSCNLSRQAHCIVWISRVVGTFSEASLGASQASDNRAHL